MGVQISPNIHRSKDQIDAEGNKVVPFSKQIIERVEKPYVPTSEEINKVSQKPVITVVPEVPKENSPIGEIIKKKVQEAVQSELAKLDIGAMVAKAISDALK